MRPPIQLHRLWRGEGGVAPAALGLIASPLAVLFGTAVRTRNLLYDVGALRAKSSPLPVFSIGNLAVGGTGKTPVAGWLTKQLSQQGWRPALLTGGYAEDEVLLHRRWNPDVPVIAARRRLDGVLEAIELDRNVIVMDDGFQHRRLARETDIVLLSPAHRLPPRLLPRGPFREPLRALRRARFILVTAKGAHEIDEARALAVELQRIPGIPPVSVFPLEAGKWETLDGARESPPNGLPLAVCSVAEPGGFLRIVRTKVGEKPEILAFPDHHRYTDADIVHISKRAASRWIATTEKDAVKLVEFRELLPPVRVLPLVVAASPMLADRLLMSLGTRGPAEGLG